MSVPWMSVPAAPAPRSSTAPAPCSAAPSTRSPCTGRPPIMPSTIRRTSGAPSAWPSRSAREIAGVAPGDIAGIGFDATCSLVVRDRDGGQLSVSTTGDERWDTIVWLDHRALAEADECTASRPYGARLSSAASCRRRWSAPKLMWLKRNLPGQLGPRRPFLRPGGLPDLPGQRLAGPFAMHARLQMDVSRA